MGALGILGLLAAFIAAFIAVLYLICEISLMRRVDDEFFVAVNDDRDSTFDSDNGIEWYPDCALPEAKGRYWTRHPEAPNHVFEGTRWNGSMWISEDGHPCYFQQREWTYPVEQAAA